MSKTRKNKGENIIIRGAKLNNLKNYLRKKSLVQKIPGIIKRQSPSLTGRAGKYLLMAIGEPSSVNIMYLSGPGKGRRKFS